MRCSRPQCSKKAEVHGFACRAHWDILPIDVRGVFEQTIAMGYREGTERFKEAARRAYDFWRDGRVTSVSEAQAEAVLRGPMSDDAEIIESLRLIEEGLTEWELNFIENVVKQFESSLFLSDKQRKIAEEIIRKHDV